jgi:hypothetical protein
MLYTLNAPVELLPYPGLGCEKIPTALCCFRSRGTELENVVHTLMHPKAQVSLNAEHACAEMIMDTNALLQIVLSRSIY